MPVLQVEPSGVVLEILEGETILAAAQRQGVRWPSVCGGMAQCRTCWFHRLDDAERYSAPEALERAALALVAPMVHDSASVRLACQTRLLDDGRARKVGVRAAPPKSP